VQIYQILRQSRRYKISYALTKRHALSLEDTNQQRKQSTNLYMYWLICIYTILATKSLSY